MFIALLVDLALAGGASYTYTVEAPGSAVAAAWALAAGDRDLVRRADKVADGFLKRDPFEAFDEEFNAGGSTLLGVLEYPIHAKVRVRATGLTSSEVTLSFEPTRTVGEQAAWKRLSKKLPVWAQAELDALHQPEPVESAALSLKAESSCAGQVDRLARSPWPEAGAVLIDALEVIPDRCTERLLGVVGRMDSGEEVGAAWLEQRHADAADKTVVIGWIRSYPAPSEPLRTLVEADDARIAAEEAAAEERRLAALAQAGARGGGTVSLGLTRGQIQSVYEKPEIGFRFQASSDVDGEPRVMGMAPNGLATLELIGPPDQLTAAALLIGVPNDNPQALLENGLYALGLAKLAFPEWPGAADWVSDNLLPAVEQGSMVTTRGGKELSIVAASELGLVVISVRRTE